MTNGYGWKEHVHVLHINFSTLHWVSWLLVNSLDISHSKKSHVSRLCRLVFSPKGLELICENLPMYCLKMDLLKWTLTANCFFTWHIFIKLWDFGTSCIFSIHPQEMGLSFCLEHHSQHGAGSANLQVNHLTLMAPIPTSFTHPKHPSLYPNFIILYGGFFKWGSSSHHDFFKLSHGHPWL